jgi:hypothetical protein
MAEQENERDTFTIPEAIADAAALHGLIQAMNYRGWNTGDFDGVKFQFLREEFDKLVLNCLGNMLYHFASVIDAMDCDALLLTGRTARLPAVQRLLRWFLPFPTSRIIPLEKYHTGPWYPFQDARRPGEIADPKCSVVVGSVVEYLCAAGRAPGNVRIRVTKSPRLRTSFYWGLASDDMRQFRNSEALFAPVPQLVSGGEGAEGDEAAEARASYTQVGRETIIARRLSADERAEVSPIYCVAIKARDRLSPITVTLERTRTESGEEALKLVGAEGTVDGQPAEVNKNVFLELRTLFEERYFLDIEPFYGIDYSSIPLD